MEAGWSVELAAEDPVILVPWQAPAAISGQAPAFIDLRERPEAIYSIEEAVQQPALRSALLTLNHPQSKLWTAKCDMWSSEAGHEMDGIDAIDRFEMDALPEETKFSAGSYIDILSRNLEMSGSFAMQESWIRGLTAKLRDGVLRCARTDFVLRRAEVSGLAGFGVTWFVEGCGRSAELAVRKWAEALAHALPTVMDGTG